MTGVLIKEGRCGHTGRHTEREDIGKKGKCCMKTED